MKAVILNMTVDKRWWLQCCLKSDTHAGVHVQTNTHTHTETKVRLSFKQEIMYQKYSVLLLYTLSHAHPHLLVSSLISIIALEVLLCDFILFKAPQWHHGECIGHLTHAPHVSEYISNTAISSRLLKHHVPHGAVWVGGLNIYRWISSLKMSSSLQYKTPYCISCPNVSFFYLDVLCLLSHWLLSVKREQPLSQDIVVYFLKLLPCLTLSLHRPVWHSVHLYVCTIDLCSIDFLLL